MPKPIVLSVIAQKGGVGKSTSAIALALEASKRGKKTILIDLDSQASVTTSLAEDGKYPESLNSYNFVKSEKCLEPINVRDNLDLIPASFELLKFDTEDFESYFLLEEKIEQCLSDYDLVVIDTPGTMRTSVIASMTASNYIYSPIELNSYSLKAFEPVAQTYKNVRKRFNGSLEFLGFLANRVHQVREIDGVKVPFQKDERAIYEELIKKNPCLYLLEDLVEIRRAISLGKRIDETTPQVTKAQKQIEGFSSAVLERIGL